MASPSYTYTLTNGTTADADEVMQNFNDILNGVSDGTDDLSISALTVAGTATFNGSVTLGNASGDDVTVTGSLASHIPVKTTDTYNVGAATLGLLSIYFGNNSQTVRVMASGSASATWTLTLPAAAGNKGQVPYDSDGSGTLGWSNLQMGVHSVSSDNYTVTDTDGHRIILMTTGASNRTLTLPTASDNTGRILTVKKSDSGAGKIVLTPEGAETLDGRTDYTLWVQYDSYTFQSDGANWQLIAQRHAPYSMIRVDTGNGHGSTNTKIRRFSNTTESVGSDITYADTAANGGSFTVQSRGMYAVSYVDRHSSSASHGISVNSSELTTSIASITRADSLGRVNAAANEYTCHAATVRLDAGDVVRAHTQGTQTDTGDSVQFIISQVAKF